MQTVKRLVSIPEARQVLGGIGHTTLYELIKKGEVNKVNIGRRGFVTSESLEAYVDRLSADPRGTDAACKTRTSAIGDAAPQSNVGGA
ncbi:helix-turn-helix domain-containing protein [Mycobacterium simiae]|uniref:helix-turn-helix domain-containing protein n=1 Tax=Mycobacterium simiae TaxID=1784 RepID=UPI0015941E53|nr:helix-turn-helix domain-containing protein [Mycobacterium simiae]